MGSSHKIDIGSLLAGGQHRIAVDQRVALEPFEGICFPQPAEVRLTIAGRPEMLEIEGSIDVVARGECDRCLGTADRQMHLPVSEKFPVDREGADPFAESNVLTGERLDVADLTSQLVYSATPMGWLCSDSCSGLCPVCGENRNERACACEHVNGETSGESQMEDSAE